MSLSSGDIATMLKSDPIKVHWAGFESDTCRMQQAGWTVSAWEDVRCMQMQLAFSRDGGRFNVGQPNVLKGISSRFSYDYRGRMAAMQGYGTYNTEVVAEIQAVGSRVHLHEHGGIDISSKFHPVDATPQMWSGKITGLDDYGHFVPKGNLAPQDIIVADESVEELLAKILKAQQPAKLERATSQYYDEKAGLLVPKVHAKIVTLEEYRKAG